MIDARRLAGARLVRRGAWIAFVAAVVLSPLHAEVTLRARTVPPVYSDYTNFILPWADIAALAAVTLWAASLVLQPRRIDLGPWFLKVPIVGVLALAWLGVPFSIDSPLAAETALHLMLAVALAVYVVNEIDDSSRLAIPVALVVVTQAGIGIAQVIAQRSFGLGLLGERSLDPSRPVSVVTENDGTRILRAYGLTDHPNVLGGVLAVGLILVGGAFAARSARFSWLRVVAVAVGVAGLFLSFSRGAWVALLAGLAVLVAILIAAHDRTGLRRLAAVCACGVVVGAPFVAPYQPALAARTDQASTNVTERRSIDERLALADATARIITTHPVLGTGIGTLPEAMHAADPGSQYGNQPAHVVTLVVTAETGIAGGLLYLVLLVAPWVALWRLRSRWTTELAVASAALATLLVVGLFDYYTWTFSSGRIWSWLALGLWAGAYGRATRGARDAA